MAKKKKRQRTPETLWRLFREKALTLSDAILSLLLLPLPPQCRCITDRRRSSRCLRCSVLGGGDGKGVVMSGLVRADDEAEYRELMNNCYVVVPENAPPIAVDASSVNRWSQRQIVCRTIQRILTEKPESSNVICNGYQMLTDSSPIVKLLSSGSWQKLLQRIGDEFMCYLLMHTLIFLPRPNNKHQQVAGQPVSCSYANSNRHLSQPSHQSSMPSRRKRRRVDKNFCSNEELPCDQTKQLDYPKVTRSNGSVGDEQKCSSSTEMHGNLQKRLRLCSGLDSEKCKLSAQQGLNVLNPLTAPDADTVVQTYHRNDLTPRQISQTDKVYHVEQDRESKGVPATQVSVRCLCCLLLRTSAELPKGTQINLKPMFYNLECPSSPLSKKHILNSLKPDSLSTSFLIKDILGLSDVKITPQAIRCCHNRSFCLYHSFSKVLKKMVHRAQHCQHSKLLDKHCPIRPSFDNTNKDGVALHKDNQTEPRLHDNREFSSVSNDSGSGNRRKLQKSKDGNICLNKSYCSNHEVVSFIWAACRNIVPPTLLGSPSTWRILRRNIYRCIQLRRFEKFYLFQGLKKLKASSFPLLSDMYSFCCTSAPVKSGIIQPDGESNKFAGFNISTLKHNLFERWIFWLFSRIVVPLVEANFYVTESQHGKQNVYYYRKSVWMDLSGKASNCWKDETCRTLDDGSVKNILAKRPFGFSKVRLCPKSSGTRVIANLKASSRILQGNAKPLPATRKVSSLKSVNCVLRDLLVVLKDYRKIEPEKWGSSVFDYNDVYRKLRPFLMNMKKESTVPSVFIVSADVHKAFDTINQDKLLAVINETFTEDEYVLQISYEIGWSKKSLFAYKNQRLVVPPENDLGAANVRFSHPYRRHAIIVNEERSRTIRKEELQLILTEHVKRNVLQINQSFMLQLVGIPQGSALSSYLCSLYFGHLERNVIVPFIDTVSTHIIREQAHNIDASIPKTSTGMALSSPKWILLRLIDDFLFISTSEELSTGFFSRMQRGIREYNCYMNKDKLCSSFDVHFLQGVVLGSKCVSIDGSSFIQWSGLLINLSTLEMLADYTRYHNNHLSSSLTICWRGQPGRHLKTKLCDYMRPKCHPLFYDPNLNSPAIIRLNVYQAFLLCAMKFHCYVCELSNVCKLRPRFYLSIILRSLRYTRKLMKRRMTQMDPDCGRKLFAQLPREEMHWLGLTAYVRSLTKKQSRHKVLLRLLKAKLVALGNIGTSPEMQYAVDDSHSSSVWKIKY